MQLQFTCPFWGCELDDAKTFFNRVLQDGYYGVEIYLQQSSKEFIQDFFKQLEKIKTQNTDFIFIAQEITSPLNDSVDSYISKMEQNLFQLTACQPTFINAHTGKDYFSFDDNCKVIEAALNISSKTGIRILHETHRGRFSFHSATLLSYLKKFPELELVGDFSHFCIVSESLLEDQEEIIQQIIPHISHIHARVGHEQSPQVNNPVAPEWQHHISVFINWWKKIILYKQTKGYCKMTITPEFGPAPYMPSLPITQEPLSNQWQNNIFIMNKLKEAF